MVYAQNATKSGEVLQPWWMSLWLYDNSWHGYISRVCYVPTRTLHVILLLGIYEWFVITDRSLTDTPKRAAEWLGFSAFRNASREMLLSTSLLLNVLPWTDQYHIGYQGFYVYICICICKCMYIDRWIFVDMYFLILDICACSSFSKFLHFDKFT